MPGKMARSAAHPPFRTVHVAAAVRATRLPCQNAGKAPKFALVRRFIWGIPANNVAVIYPFKFFDLLAPTLNSALPISVFFRTENKILELYTNRPFSKS